MPVPDDLLKRLKKYKMDNPEKSFVIGNAKTGPENSSAAVAEKLVKDAGLNCGHCEKCKGREECERWFLHKFRAAYCTPAASFIGYAGGNACSQTDLCDVFVTSAIIFANSTTDELETGSLTLEPSIITGQTSEPSTLALLSTGILGLVGAARRKFISRS